MALTFWDLGTGNSLTFWDSGTGEGIHSHFDQIPILEDVILVTLERGEVTHTVIYGYTRGEGDSWE